MYKENSLFKTNFTWQQFNPSFT